MFGPPEPPQWPRSVARVFGTMGFLLVSPFVLMLALAMLDSADDINDNDFITPQFYLYALLMLSSGLALALGLLVAWRREGLGALLILGGSTILVVSTFGLALVVIFPAYAVGGLYLFSWALHRADDFGDNVPDRFSRWVRRQYYSRRIETF
jgi:hypothetical protein